MGQINTKLSDLLMTEGFRVSYPLRSDLYRLFQNRFPQLPAIIINPQKQIIFGHDFYKHFKEKNIKNISCLEIAIRDEEALLLNYNLRASLTKPNLYEKLIFIQKYLEKSSLQDLIEKSNLSIPINQKLLQQIPILLSTEFSHLLQKDQIMLKTAIKLSSLSKSDRKPLLDLFSQVPFSASHQAQIIEVAEEIQFQEKISLLKIFNQLKIHKFLNRQMPQKKIIQILMDYRYPEYSKAEKKWKQELKKLKLPNNITISHSPFFEKNHLFLSIQLKNKSEFKDLISKIKGSLPSK